MGCAPSGGQHNKALSAQLFAEAGKGANYDTLYKLIASKANINANVDKDNRRTALHHAARNGKLESARCLLALQADIGIRDKDKVTPLGLAEWKHHSDVVKLLRDAAKGHGPGLALNRKLFETAEKGGSWDKINPLIGARANINAQVVINRTPLHAAARNGHIESVRCLLALKADTTITDKDKVTALGLAEWKHHGEIAKLLREAARGKLPTVPVAKAEDKASSSKTEVKEVKEVIAAPAPSAPGWDPSGPLAPIPAYWDNRDTSIDFVELVPVLGQMEQFQQLLDTTFAQVSTRDRGGAELPAKLQVALVQRMENRNLWQRYSTGRKRVMERRGGRCTPLKNMSGGAAKTLSTDAGFADTAAVEGLEAGINEVLLFHGTSPESALGIAKTGFDLSRSATGTLYGPGVYTAEMCSKSDEYSSKSTDGLWSGLHALLLCRAVLGEMLTMTVGGESVYPVVKAALDSGSYDAVLGDRQASSGTYREFVMYRADCLYPEYVILYTRLTQAGALASNNAADTNEPSEPTS